MKSIIEEIESVLEKIGADLELQPNAEHVDQVRLLMQYLKYFERDGLGQAMDRVAFNAIWADHKPFLSKQGHRHYFQGALWSPEALQLADIKKAAINDGENSEKIEAKVVQEHVVPAKMLIECARTAAGANPHPSAKRVARIFVNCPVAIVTESQDEKLKGTLRSEMPNDWHLWEDALWARYKAIGLDRREFKTMDRHLRDMQCTLEKRLNRLQESLERMATSTPVERGTEELRDLQRRANNLQSRIRRQGTPVRLHGKLVGIARALDPLETAVAAHG